MQQKHRRIILSIVSVLTVAVLLSWFGLLLARKVNLTTADLGRHIKNGELWVSGGEAAGLLSANFYSYTSSDYPFINHHWGSGVLFYLLWYLFGFTGLSVFYVLLGIGTLALFMDAARKMGGLAVTIITSVPLLPLMASRAEVRPEMLTYFFSGLFFWLLWHSRQGLKSQKWLYVLPVVTLLWANIHIGFFFGLLLIGAFWAEDVLVAVWQKVRGVARPDSAAWYRLGVVWLLSAAAALVNPQGFSGLLYPLNIFKNYGYLIVENRSVWFLERLGYTADMHFLLLKIILVVLALSFAAVAWLNRKQFSRALFFIAIGVSIMALFGIRNFPFLGFFALPALVYNVQVVRKRFPALGYFTGSFRPVHAVVLPVIVFLLLISFTHQYWYMQARRNVIGFGLSPAVNAQNEELIKRFEMPKDRFGVTSK